MTRFFRIEHNGDPRHVIDEGGRWRLLEGELFGRYQAGDVIPSNGRRLLAPSKIVAVGLNYKDHAAEQNSGSIGWWPSSRP